MSTALQSVISFQSSSSTTSTTTNTITNSALPAHNSQTSIISVQSTRRLPTPQARVQHQLVIENARRDLVIPFRSKIYNIFKVISNIGQFFFLSYVCFLARKDEFCGYLPVSFVTLILLNTFILSVCYFHRLLFLKEYLSTEEQEDLYEDADFDNEVGQHSKTTKLLKRTTSLLEYSLFYIVLLGTFSILGDECVKKSPILFGGIVCIITYNVLISLLPLLVFVLFICFLPFVIMFFRFTHKEPSNGVAETDLSKIPCIEYNSAAGTIIKDEVIIEEEDATCSICLQNYEDGVMLRILNCSHHFHKSCSDEWFKLQATCPLCVRPIIEEIGDLGEAGERRNLMGENIV